MTRRDEMREAIAGVCQHGFMSSLAHVCVCAYGWRGKLCDEDALASCRAARHATAVLVNRSSAAAALAGRGDGRHGGVSMAVATLRFQLHRAPWTCDLLSLLDEAEGVNCHCLAACAKYLEQVRESGISVRPIALRKQPSCARTLRSTIDTTFKAAAPAADQMRREALEDRVKISSTDISLLSTASLSTAAHVSMTNCFASCSGRGQCFGHFCECDAGTVGPTCRDAARAHRQPPDPDELRVRLLELPASMQYELASRYRGPTPSVPTAGSSYNGAALLEKRMCYWGQPYFYSHLVRTWIHAHGTCTCMHAYACATGGSPMTCPVTSCAMTTSSRARVANTCTIHTIHKA